MVKDLSKIKNAKECKVASTVIAGIPGASETSSGALVMLPIGKLYPHPDNPRKKLGDLTELADSIKAKGVMQNLTVVPGHYLTDEECKELNAEYNDHPTEEIRSRLNQAALHRPVEDGYTIIIGHRRHAAAKKAKLKELPLCYRRNERAGSACYNAA